jgi:hypothetical protein
MFTSGSAHGEATGQLEGERLYHASLDSTEDKQLLESHRFDVVASVPEDGFCYFARVGYRRDLFSQSSQGSFARVSRPRCLISGSSFSMSGIANPFAINRRASAVFPIWA